MKAAEAEAKRAANTQEILSKYRYSAMNISHNVLENFLRKYEDVAIKRVGINILILKNIN